MGPKFAGDAHGIFGMLEVSSQDRISDDRIFKMVHEEPKILLTVREGMEAF